MYVRTIYTAFPFDLQVRSVPRLLHLARNLGALAWRPATLQSVRRMGNHSNSWAAASVDQRERRCAARGQGHTSPRWRESSERGCWNRVQGQQSEAGRGGRRSEEDNCKRAWLQVCGWSRRSRQHHSRVVTVTCVCMYVCMYVCVYLYMHIYIHTRSLARCGGGGGGRAEHGRHVEYIDR